MTEAGSSKLPAFLWPRVSSRASQDGLRVRLRGLLSQCLCSQDHKDLQILQRRNGEVAPSGRTQKRLSAVASADDEVQVTEQSLYGAGFRWPASPAVHSRPTW